MTAPTPEVPAERVEEASAAAVAGTSAALAVVVTAVATGVVVGTAVTAVAVVESVHEALRLLRPEAKAAGLGVRVADREISYRMERIQRLAAALPASPDMADLLTLPVEAQKSVRFVQGRVSDRLVTDASRQAMRAAQARNIVAETPAPRPAKQHPDTPDVLALPEVAALLAEVEKAGEDEPPPVVLHRNPVKDAAAAGPEWGVMIIPERDACLDCTRLAGMVIADGDLVMLPPYHRNCRCGTRVVHIESSRSARAAVRREANRSVAKGWSLPSESSTARAQAAAELLERGTSLPKSVRAETRARLDRPQEFGRPVPVYRR